MTYCIANSKIIAAGHIIVEIDELGRSKVVRGEECVAGVGGSRLVERASNGLLCRRSIHDVV